MFAHLHLHTEYSLLDGACRISKLLKEVKALGMNSCAITDHGVMYGVVDFYKEAKKQGIHPVIGCEVYVCQNMDDKQSTAREYAHLVLLCETQRGYNNLIKMVSDGFTRGFYYKPRIDMATLAKHSEGLIMLSACLSGDIPKLILDGRTNDAKKLLEKFVQIFKKENVFLEIQDHGIAGERQVVQGLIELSKETGIPLVATNDVHYLKRDDSFSQEVLMCVQTGKTIDDPSRMRMETDQLYLKTEAEMLNLFPHLPDAIARTEEIAKRCHVEFDFSKVHLPQYSLPEGETARGLLRKLCYEGIKRLYDNAQVALDRLEYELGVIESMGYVDYFLIVWDFIKYAKSNKILVGPGRGSGAGSIVAYSLDITGVDPLKYNLLFERFLNPERISMPDLDIDFCYENRQKVIDYVTHKYGNDHVAQIITFGTMAARAVIRDVGRALNMSYAEVDQIAKQIPFALDMSLEKALLQNPELKRMCDENNRAGKLFEVAKLLEGMPRHASTHAAGVLITHHPVSDYVPLQTNDNIITTQFPMNTLESMGLLKMDFLGLRTLTVIGYALEMIDTGYGIKMKPEEIPLDDPKVYTMIAAADTDGVFQLEGGGMRTFLTNLKPSSFEEIIAAISLYRPGPMESIPRFILGKEQPDTVKYLTPALEPILEVTNGCMVYQEQVMQIVRDIAGYSLGRSDLMRRAMSKKKKDVMAEEKQYFIHGLIKNGEVVVPGAIRKGVPEAVAEEIFNQMSDFASYAFNKAHAAAYAVIAVQTAYLKYYYPAEFMAATMNSIMGNEGKIAAYIQYCRKHGIKVLPPDVNLSGAKFSVDRSSDAPAIRFGLSAVKNVGHNAVEAIVAEAKTVRFKDIYDFCARINTEYVGKRAVECLIKAGAFTSLPGSRTQHLKVFEVAMDGAAQVRKRNVAGQISLFGLDTQHEFVNPPLPDIQEYSLRALLTMEKEMTGIYISGHPLDEYREELEAIDTTTQWLNQLATEEGADTRYDGLSVRIAGMIIEKHTKTTKTGNLMAFVTLEDLYGQVEALVFPKVYEKFGAMLQPDSIVMIEGKLSLREDEEPKLLLDGVAPLRKLEDNRAIDQPFPFKNGKNNQSNSANKMYVKVDNVAVRDEILPLLKRFRGNMPVYIHITDLGKTFLAPREAWVSDDIQLEELRIRLGAANVIIKTNKMI